MKRKRIWMAVAIALFAVASIVAVRFALSGGAAPVGADPAGGQARTARPEKSATASEEPRKASAKSDPAQAAPRTQAEEIPEEKPEEDPGEKAVKAFEALTDSLMEPVKGEITLDKVDTFVNAFKALPEKVREEELHHALNLIPDENAMYLLGILMDMSLDKPLLELVFNDFLNRDDSVKQPTLKAVFKQKSHPCWADAAWILDVTK